MWNRKRTRNGRNETENQEQQQTAETQAAQGQEPAQDGQTQTKPQRANLIADGDVDWKELEQFGVKRENLSEKDMKALMNYGKTRLVTVEPVLGGERYELQARLSLQKAEDGKLKLTPTSYAMSRDSTCHTTAIHSRTRTSRH